MISIYLFFGVFVIALLVQVVKAIWQWLDGPGPTDTRSAKEKNDAMLAEYARRFRNKK